VAIGYGDYAVLELQFRVGDGEGCRHDFEALGFLSSLWIPWVVWDGHTHPDDIHDCFLRHKKTPSGHYPQKLLVIFEATAIATHYGDSMFVEAKDRTPGDLELVLKGMKILDTKRMDLLTRVVSPMSLHDLYRL